LTPTSKNLQYHLRTRRLNLQSWCSLQLSLVSMLSHVSRRFAQSYDNLLCPIKPQLSKSKKGDQAQRHQSLDQSQSLNLGRRKRLIHKTRSQTMGWEVDRPENQLTSKLKSRKLTCSQKNSR
jgi:hypothetical protein